MSERSASTQGSREESWSSGGTAGALPAERELATFDPDRMAEAIYGGADAVKRRRFILMPAANLSYPDKHEWSREKLMATSIKDFIEIHKDFVLEGYRPQRDEVSWMGEMAINTGSMMPHMGLFLPTIAGQGSPEQVAAWLPRAVTFQIIGCYAQTELSHGSNVRGLRTTATYDRSTEEFIMDTPTLGSMKWWNSNIGCAATHAAVYAQLIIDGKEYGLHVFMVQIRDENHHLLPGVEAGDCGPKLGDAAIDTGYLRLNKVRIPREHLFAKRQHVEPDGTYVRHERSKDPQKQALAKRTAYLTMMQARSGMTSVAAGKLSLACTIAIRYSCVRRQGFLQGGDDTSFKSGERQVIDYGVQRHRLFKQLAICFCIRASGNWMNNAVVKLAEAASAGSEAADELLSAMPETHASSAGLKGVCVKLAADGMEDLRKACGGHGYLLTSGIGGLAADFVWQVTAEGDFIVLLLQTARFLIKSRADAKAGKPLAGLASCLAPLGRPDFRVESMLPRPPSTVDQACSTDFLMAMFEYRTLSTVVRAGNKLDAAIAQGMQPEDAWNSCAVTLKAAAETHIYYFMLRNFIDIIKTQSDPHVVPALQDLCALFALQNMEQGEHWAGLLSAETIDVVETAIAAILDRLRPNAVALVDAFQIPDRLLGALGRSDGNVYEDLYEQARASELNQRKGPFAGFEESLKPHLDADFLSLRGKACEELRADSKL